MPPLPRTWYATAPVGHESIDADHRAIDDAIRALNRDLAFEADARIKLLSGLRELRALAVRHFEEEARLMLGSEFPNPNQHLRDHTRCLDMIDRHIGRLERVFSPSGPEQLDQIRHWFAAHAFDFDQELVDHLTKADAEPSTER